MLSYPLGHTAPAILFEHPYDFFLLTAIENAFNDNVGILIEIHTCEFVLWK